MPGKARFPFWAKTFVTDAMHQAIVTYADAQCEGNRQEAVRQLIEAGLNAKRKEPTFSYVSI